MPVSYSLCFALEPSDEIGFVHPSQFVNLNEEARHSVPSSSDSVSNVLCSAEGNTMFWNRDHKLGISTEVLIPLYKEVKHALMAANRTGIESEIMNHSRAALLISSDFGTAWHSRYISLTVLVISYTFSTITICKRLILYM